MAEATESRAAPASRRGRLWPWACGLLLLLCVLGVLAYAPMPSVHDAAEDGSAVWVRVRLLLGADVNARDGLGLTPLHRAAFRQRSTVVEVLLDAGADINARSNDRRTPLGLAAKHPDHALADMLARRRGR